MPFPGSGYAAVPTSDADEATANKATGPSSPPEYTASAPAGPQPSTATDEWQELVAKVPAWSSDPDSIYAVRHFITLVCERRKIRPSDSSDGYSGTVWTAEELHTATAEDLISHMEYVTRPASRVTAGLLAKDIVAALKEHAGTAVATPVAGASNTSDANAAADQPAVQYSQAETKKMISALWGLIIILLIIVFLK